MMMMINERNLCPWCDGRNMCSTRQSSLFCSEERRSTIWWTGRTRFQHRARCFTRQPRRFVLCSFCWIGYMLIMIFSIFASWLSHSKTPVVWSCRMAALTGLKLLGSFVLLHCTTPGCLPTSRTLIFSLFPLFFFDTEVDRDSALTRYSPALILYHYITFFLWWYLNHDSGGALRRNFPE